MTNSHEYEGTLELQTDPRVERFETKSPMGYIIEVTRNCETGESSYTETDRTDYTVPADGS